LDLAMRESGSWTTTSEIAQRKLIPSPLIRQIITQLVKSGLVHSRRGTDGGVTLARPSGEISLLDVVQSIEGPFHLNRCIGQPDDCPLTETCPVHLAWERAQEGLEAQLGVETFDKLARQAAEPDPAAS
jgi:Rrf2 family protein